MKSNSKTTAVALVILLACFPAIGASASECRKGIWDIKASGKTVDGQEWSGVATSIRYCLFDGTANLDEYRALSPDGKLVFIGASFDFPSNDGQRIQTLWVMGGDPGYTLIDGKMIDGRLVSTGKGSDAGGEFLERSVYTFADDRDYTFDMDRSFDGGKTWIRSFSKSSATFRTEEVPPLPVEYHPILEQAINALENPPGGTIILGGLAQMEELETSLDGKEGPAIRFSSRYMGPDRLQSVYWTLGSDQVQLREVKIGQPE
ncbi:MAG: hypothetical protein WBS20_08965 [Lysobacterales bacterium]